MLSGYNRSVKIADLRITAEATFTIFKVKVIVMESTRIKPGFVLVDSGIGFAADKAHLKWFAVYIDFGSSGGSLFGSRYST